MKKNRAEERKRRESGKEGGSRLSVGQQEKRQEENGAHCGDCRSIVTSGGLRSGQEDTSSPYKVA